ncbi:MAG: acyltransferase [bacterium]
MIVFGHLGGFWFWRPYSEVLNVFVPIFFFISGAVSYYSFKRSATSWQYIKKRIIQLLVPYYGICLCALLVFMITQRTFPALSVSKLSAWLFIIPYHAIMPFPLGQVWFLHTLSVITIISPLYFYVYERKPLALYALLGISLCMAGIQLRIDIAPFFVVGGHNLFKPLVHILFFCLGFLVFEIPSWSRLRVSWSIISLSFILSIFLWAGLKLNPDFAFHTYSPTLYYVAGSICSIWIFLLLRRPLLLLFRSVPLFSVIVKFLFTHTFAIYLIHSFSIYFVEEIFGLIHPQNHLIFYVISKVTLVMLITFVLAPPFTRITSLITGTFLGKRQLHRPVTA